ncbi:AAA family ATPase [Runella aurantiaca]|uniref:ATPase AAA-type core domain-containing protein n=1 Tax=Runella aurantiaca TaxID=2282308 RepID=A0A369I7K9_9BACT|nr:AAA family ATPase [Runella aurantiaca]RDB04487.1 hypothetical protein DVG78_18855 [Runella aurantiaca]
MYIKKVTINNIRSISDFEMTFPEPAGWHVVIGDNGAGKSTVVKSIALALLDITDINAAGQDWDEWLKNDGTLTGSTELMITPFESNQTIQNRITFEKEFVFGENSYSVELDKDVEIVAAYAMIREVIFRGKKTFDSALLITTAFSHPVPTPTIRAEEAKQKREYWFSAGYGPFRRFTGGSQDKEKIYKTNPNLGSHLSVFGEDVALPEALNFLRDLYIEELEANKRLNESRVKTKPKSTLENLIKFINEAHLLPHGAVIDAVGLKEVYFKDGYGNTVSSLQMSDGYRSILSMTFELIRQLIRVYGNQLVFENINNGKNIIDLPGVVLIDEIDAHLHPTWQTRIGEWFTKYFPKIQFIVTTHSPLVCRACEKGSIWRLASPGSDTESGEVKGLERERLIFGNILDAYGTELFGQSPVRSEKTDEKQKRLGQLNMLSAFGKITEEEEKERLKLQQTLSTNAPIN